MKYSEGLKEFSCSACNIIQPIDQFRICKTPKENGGFHISYANICETCNRQRRIDKYNSTKKNDPDFKKQNREKSNAYRQKNMEKVRESAKRRYYADVEKTRAKARDLHKKYVAQGKQRTNPEYTKFKNKFNVEKLTDTYVKHQIRNQLGRDTIVTPEMIIIKRQELELLRTERLLKKILSFVPKEIKPRGFRPVSEKNLADHKICNTCKVDQPIGKFARRKTLRRKLPSKASQCNSCRGEYKKKWRKKKYAEKQPTIQIIPFKDQPTCEEFWGVKVGNIYQVNRAKVWRGEPIWYYITVTVTSKNMNSYGQSTEIRIKPSECKIIE